MVWTHFLGRILAGLIMARLQTVAYAIDRVVWLLLWYAEQELMGLLQVQCLDRQFSCPDVCCIQQVEVISASVTMTATDWANLAAKAGTP